MVKRDVGQIKAGKPLAGYDPGGDLCQWHAGGLGDERNRPAAARVDLKEIDVVILDRKLDVHKTNDAKRTGQSVCLSAQFNNQFF